MNKSWEKIQNDAFAFFVDKTEIGQLVMKPHSSSVQAIALIQGKEYGIKRTGIWKNNVEISDENNQVVAHTRIEKWYAQTLTLTYLGQSYQLITRNNPLAEMAITYKGSDILAYGLHAADNRDPLAVRITASSRQDEYIFDFLLWYLFWPIATESMGDYLTFTLLMTA